MAELLIPFNLIVDLTMHGDCLAKPDPELHKAFVALVEEVQGHSKDEIERLQSELAEASDELQRVHGELQAALTESDSLRRVAALALLMARHGGYDNGVTSPEGWDEGLVRASDSIAIIEAEATVLGVWLDGQTFYEIDKHYEDA